MLAILLLFFAHTHTFTHDVVGFFNFRTAISVLLTGFWARHTNCSYIRTVFSEFRCFFCKLTRSDKQILQGLCGVQKILRIYLVMQLNIKRTPLFVNKDRYMYLCFFA